MAKLKIEEEVATLETNNEELKHDSGTLPFDEPEVVEEETVTPVENESGVSEETTEKEPVENEEQGQEKAVDVAEEEQKEAEENAEDKPKVKVDTSVGLTDEQVKELKKQYKKLFLTDYMGQRYVWHRLNRKSFNAICDETEDIEDEDEMLVTREKEIVKACVVYPDMETLETDIEDDMISTRIGREILYHSGFYPPQTVEL